MVVLSVKYFFSIGDMYIIRFIFRFITLPLHVVLSWIIVNCALPNESSVSPKLSGRQRFLMQSTFRLVLKIVGIKVKVLGAIDDRANLFLSNHISWLDIIILGVHAPASFIAKQQIKNWPFIGAIATKFGSIFINRGALGSEGQEMIGAHLSGGGSVVLFPEGCIRPTFKVRKFILRILREVEHQGLRVQPLAIAYPLGGKGNEAILERGGWHLVRVAMRLFRGPSTNVTLCCLPSFDASQMSYIEIGEKAHSLLTQEIRKAYPDEEDV